MRKSILALVMIIALVGLLTGCGYPKSITKEEYPISRYQVINWTLPILVDTKTGLTWVLNPRELEWRNIKGFNPKDPLSLLEGDAPVKPKRK